MNRIRQYREQCKLSQAFVAEKLDITQQAIAKWEAGESLPRADKLPQLASILGCTVDELLAADET